MKKLLIILLLVFYNCESSEEITIILEPDCDCKIVTKKSETYTCNGGASICHRTIIMSSESIDGCYSDTEIEDSVTYLSKTIYTKIQCD